MAYDFDGAGDRISYSNLFAGIDANAFTLAIKIKVPAEPSGGQVLQALAADLAAAGSGPDSLIVAPASSGFRFQLNYRFTGTSGRWISDNDYSLNTEYSFTITYDRSSVSNNPVFYVNGSSVAITETQTPVGTAKSGLDGLMFGANVAGTGAYLDAVQCEAAYWPFILDAGQAKAVAKSSPLAIPGRGYYIPLVRNPNDLIQGKIGTVSGATVVPHLRTSRPRPQIFQFPTAAAAPSGRIMSSLVSHGGLAGMGGIAGPGGGLAG